MAKCVLILGQSGSGKTASLRNIDGRFGVIEVINKPLPFKSDIKPHVSDSFDEIIKILSSEKAKAKSIFIDDAGYIITNFYLRNKTATNPFAVFDQIAIGFTKIIQTAMAAADDKIIYIVMHTDTDVNGSVMPLTVGKMLNEKVNIAGMFTICLLAEYAQGKYVFRNQTKGDDPAKAPIGMFETPTTDNDIMIIDEAIRKYYDIEIKKGAQEAPKEKENV
ncbi:MAG: ATP-binding protein [Endomicrobium sp.]|jgi:hypothetical protein|nr:ATP-binding protein [Endomicrobium sp.]